MAKGWDWIEEGERRRSRADELADAWRQRDRYRAAMFRENERGGQARFALLDVAKALGINLSSDVRGDDVWSTENMRRVLEGVQNLQYQLARSQGLHGTFHVTPIALSPERVERALADALLLEDGVTV